MPKRLPSLTALRTFEAAARHKSFSKAGEELAVTPAAVGFQIKQLEEEVGAPLFARKHRAVELTALGRAFAQKLAPPFEALKLAWQDLHPPAFDTPLRITAPDPLSLDWLVPVTQAANQIEHGPEIRLEASRDLKDIENGEFDVAIRLSRETFDQFFCETLLRKWHTPLMRPELAISIESVDDLLKLNLVQTEIQQADVWETFLRLMDVTGEPNYATTCPDPRTALELAANSEYVAIGGHFMAEKYLAAGTLVSPIPHALVYESRVLLVCPKGHETSDGILWLRNALHNSAKVIRERVHGFNLFDYDGNKVSSLQ